MVSDMNKIYKELAPKDIMILNYTDSGLYVKGSEIHFVFDAIDKLQGVQALFCKSKKPEFDYYVKIKPMKKKSEVN